MADVLTPEQHRRNMQAFRCRDTKPEIVVRSLHIGYSSTRIPRVHANGYRILMAGDVKVRSIYVGAPIEPDSERKFLASFVQWLEEKQISFVVLANLHIGGRQIDCVVATENTVSLVEVKSSYLPVRGDLNGIWARMHSSGKWQNYTNAYQQALNAKNALRDAMMDVKQVGNFYPDGYVVFTSGFAEGSQITSGDFKVAVATLDNFLSSFKVRGNSPWSLIDWQVFAINLGLIATPIDAATALPEDRKRAELVRQYNASFVAEYERDAARWLPEDAEQRSALLAEATTGAGCFISGASGCGKTLMAKWIAVNFANAGNPTFFFSAKDFTGSWADLIRREVALLSDQNPFALHHAIVRVDRPILLVMDGINEFGPQEPNALRGIRALARRLGAKLVITSQRENTSEFVGLRTIAVKRPSINLKHLIAQSEFVALSSIALEALKAVGSGLEARIIGQIGAELNANATRVILFDQYIRMRLGHRARIASFGLRRLAGSFHEKLTFSMSEANFDEFMRQQAVQFEDCDALFAAGLLVRRSGRISFSHEMIQNACAAFELARNAVTDATTFGAKLSTPILETIAGDVISAIEDASVCRAVLKEVTSAALLSAAADGEFGTIPKSTAQALLDDTAKACAAEIRSACLILIKEKEEIRVDWASHCQREWSESERARLCAIGHLATSETGLQSYLELCAAMDERLKSERHRLAEAAREVKFPLRSQSFALAYYGFGRRIGFTYVARTGYIPARRSSDIIKKLEISLAEMTSGQLHFFLENRRSLFGGDDEGRFAEELIYVMRERFRWEPYHVQLAALQAVGFAREAPKKTVQQLVEAINALDVSRTNWAINTCIIDALKVLGALDDEGDDARAQIKRELASVLVDDEAMVDKNLALSICVRMFDHPFDWIYGEEIHELDENRRRRLYRRALAAPDINCCMSSAWLTLQVASYEDSTDALLLQPLAKLPESSNPFPQEEWGRFVLATRFLGRHGAELPQIDSEDPAPHCLANIRTLIYAAESRRGPDIEAARLAWHTLHTMPTQLVVGCLGQVQTALTELPWNKSNKVYESLSLSDVYPADCLRVARLFVDDGVEAEYFNRIPMREIGPAFAFRTLGRYGDRSDLDRLHRLSHGHPFARYALAAIKSIEGISV